MKNKLLTLINISIILLLTQSCSILNRKPIRHSSKQELSQEFTLLLENKYAFSSEYFFPLRLSLPDTLGGKKLAGWAEFYSILDAKAQVIGIELISVNFYNAKTGSFFHQYWPEFQKNPIRKKYHKRLFPYLEYVARNISYSQNKESSFFESKKCEKFPAKVKLSFAPPNPKFDHILELKE